MPPFIVNSTRVDPYKNFKFRVLWDGREIPAVTHVSAPEEAAAGELTIERGMTEDSSIQDWLNDVLTRSALPNGLDDLSVISKDIQVEQLDDEGNPVASWTAIQCRPTGHEPHPAKRGLPHTEDSRERMTLMHDGIRGGEA